MCVSTGKFYTSDSFEKWIAVMSLDWSLRCILARLDLAELAMIGW